MRVSPEVVDYLLITVFELLKVLGKVAKGEEISDEDLKLESFEATLNRVKRELQK